MQNQGANASRLRNFQARHSLWIVYPLSLSVLACSPRKANRGGCSPRFGTCSLNHQLASAFQPFHNQLASLETRPLCGSDDHPTGPMPGQTHAASSARTSHAATRLNTATSSCVNTSVAGRSARILPRLIATGLVQTQQLHRDHAQQGDGRFQGGSSWRACPFRRGSLCPTACLRCCSPFSAPCEILPPTNASSYQSTRLPPGLA